MDGMDVLCQLLSTGRAGCRMLRFANEVFPIVIDVFLLPDGVEALMMCQGGTCDRLLQGESRAFVWMTLSDLLHPISSTKSQYKESGRTPVPCCGVHRNDLLGYRTVPPRASLAGAAVDSAGWKLKWLQQAWPSAYHVSCTIKLEHDGHRRERGRTLSLRPRPRTN